MSSDSFVDSVVCAMVGTRMNQECVKELCSVPIMIDEEGWERSMTVLLGEQRRLPLCDMRRSVISQFVAQRYEGRLLH